MQRLRGRVGAEECAELSTFRIREHRPPPVVTFEPDNMTTQRQQRTQRGYIHVDVYAPLDRVDLGYLVHPDDAAAGRVVKPAFTLGIRLPGQPENLRPERSGRGRLGGVEADLSESRDGHAVHASAGTVARPAGRPGGRGSGSASASRPDPTPRHRAVDDRRDAGFRAAGRPLRSWTRLRLATALARPGAGQPPQMAGGPMCRRTSRPTSRHAIERAFRR